jgi:hypothetical protein
VATPCEPVCINIVASPGAGKPGFSGQATNFRWSDDLTGYGHTFSSTEACGKPPQPYDQFTFTLTKV